MFFFLVSSFLIVFNSIRTESAFALSQFSIMFTWHEIDDGIFICNMYFVNRIALSLKSQWIALQMFPYVVYAFVPYLKHRRGFGKDK